MRVACLFLVACFLALSYVSGQTFQYSKGWTNGRKRTTHINTHRQLLGPDDVALSSQELGLLGPSSRRKTAYRDAVLRGVLEMNRQNPLESESLNDFIASRKRRQNLSQREDDEEGDDFNN